LFRVFVDEFGTHHLQSADAATERYLGLTGIIMNLDYERGEFKQQLDAIKIEIFGSANIVLHRREILNCQAPFDNLRDQKTRERFNELLLNLLLKSSYRVFTAVIDNLRKGIEVCATYLHRQCCCIRRRLRDIMLIRPQGRATVVVNPNSHN